MVSFIKKVLRFVIVCLIRLIEKYELRNASLNEDDNSKKILDSVDLQGYEVMTDSGWQKITSVHKTQPYSLWYLETRRGFKLYCADKHIVFDANLNEIFVKDLICGDFIMTVEGIDEIVSIRKSLSKICMYDIEVNSIEHRYYSNGILSHNTVISAIYLVWYLLFNHDRNVLLLANKGATTKEIIDKAKDILGNLPFFLKPGIIRKAEHSMKFDNNCRLIGASTTKSSSIGFTVHLFYADEFAHIPKNILEPLWRSIYPTLSSSNISQIIITSTPNGYNLFHKLYQGGLDGTNKFRSLFIPWWRVPGRDEAWKQGEIANMGSEELFNQEYGCQFLASSELLLNYSEISLLEKNSKKYRHLAIPELDELEINYIDLEWAETFNLSEIHEESSCFVWSVDTSEGVGSDHSVLNIFKLSLIEFEELKKKTNYTSIKESLKLNQVGRYSNNRIDPSKFASFLYDLAVFLFDQDRLKIVIEANTFGGEVIRSLYNIYEDDNEFDPSCLVKYSHRHGAEKKKDGLKLNASNKPVICSAFKRKIAEGRIELTDPKTIQEATVFTKTKDGSYAASTGHDDKIMTCINVSTIFDSIEWSDLCEVFFENISPEITEMYESLIDTKRVVNEKRNKSNDDSDDYISMFDDDLNFMD